MAVTEVVNHIRLLTFDIFGTVADRRGSIATEGRVLGV
jgi:hypothetical protein